MAFPSDLDSLTNKTDGVDYPQAADINNLNDAVEAIEAKVGVDGSAVSSSIDYKLKNTTSGHDHDGSDSKKVIATNLDITGISANAYLRVNSGGTAVEGSSLSIPSGDLVGTTATQTLSAKTLTSPVLNTGISGTAFLDEDNMASNSATKAASQQSIKAYVDARIAAISLASVWPIGSVYISVVSTNPNTLLGFGTWVAFGAGKTLVGRDSGDADFDTAEETGGEKTHTLTTAELAAHTHVQDAHGHALSSANLPAGMVKWVDPAGSKAISNGDDVSYGTHAHGLTIGNATATNQNAGSGTAHNNLQPYIVTYMWKRTA